MNRMHGRADGQEDAEGAPAAGPTDTGHGEEGAPAAYASQEAEPTDTGHGEQEAAAATPAQCFKVGDVVLCHAAKHKGHYDLKKAKITAVLSRQYRVTLFEGDAEGHSHKYLHANVSEIVEHPPPPVEDDASAKTERTVDDDHVASIRQHIDDLLD